MAAGSAGRGCAGAGPERPTGRGCRALAGRPLLGRPLGRVAGLGLLALRCLLAATLAGARPATGQARHPGHAAALGHLLHHLLRLTEALEQLVDLGGAGARALGDARAARAVDQLGVVALERGHREDHRLDPVELLLVEGVELGAHLAHAGHHAQDRLQRAHLLDGRHLLEEVVEGEVLGREELALHLGGVGAVERLLGLLDEGEHVTHVEDARGHPVGVEDLEVLHALAGAGEHDRAAGDRGHRQRRATAGVAVELGEHDTGDVDALLEGVGGLDGGLADHRVDDEQHLVGLDRGADVGGLLHQVGVDGQAAGGVDDDDVVLRAAGLLDAGARDRDRVAVAAGALARLGDDVVAEDVAALRARRPAPRPARRRPRAG